MKTASCIVKGTRSFSGEFIFDGVGNEVIEVLGFRHIPPEGACFPGPYQLQVKYSQKNSNNMINLTPATPAEGRDSVFSTRLKKARVFMRDPESVHHCADQSSPLFVDLRLLMEPLLLVTSLIYSILTSAQIFTVTILKWRNSTITRQVRAALGSE